MISITSPRLSVAVSVTRAVLWQNLTLNAGTPGTAGSYGGHDADQ